jgi:hypothetical protein
MTSQRQAGSCRSCLSRQASSQVAVAGRRACRNMKYACRKLVLLPPYICSVRAARMSAYKDSSWLQRHLRRSPISPCAALCCVCKTCKTPAGCSTAHTAGQDCRLWPGQAECRCNEHSVWHTAVCSARGHPGHFRDSVRPCGEHLWPCDGHRVGISRQQQSYVHHEQSYVHTGLRALSHSSRRSSVCMAAGRR